MCEVKQFLNTCPMELVGNITNYFNPYVDKLEQKIKIYSNDLKNNNNKKKKLKKQWRKAYNEDNKSDAFSVYEPNGYYEVMEKEEEIILKLDMLEEQLEWI